jgi:hypothetical protein
LIVTCDGIIGILPHEIPDDDGVCAPMLTAARLYYDGAVRDYRTHLETVLKRKPATVNNALAAIEDLYLAVGQGRARHHFWHRRDREPRRAGHRAHPPGIRSRCAWSVAAST